MFSGSIVALVTPFRKGEIDEEAYRGLVEWHIEAGTHGLVPCGTTGEAPTLSMRENKAVNHLVIFYNKNTFKPFYRCRHIRPVKHRAKSLEHFAAF